MNKRGVITALLFAVGGIALVLFGLLLCQDYLVLYPHGSAPFGVYVVFRAVEFLLPGAICLAAGIAVKRRTGKN